MKARNSAGLSALWSNEVILTSKCRWMQLLMAISYLVLRAHYSNYFSSFFLQTPHLVPVPPELQMYQTVLYRLKFKLLANVLFPPQTFYRNNVTTEYKKIVYYDYAVHV